jgi:hypothetical protein
MRAFAWFAGVAAVMALAPGAALAAKPAKANEPKPKPEAKIAPKAPAKEPARGGKKVEGKPPVEAKAPGKAEPRGKAHGHARKETPAEAPPSPPEATKQRAGHAGKPARVGRGKVTLCHATGSATNPYVVVTVSVNATTGNGHGRHADDVIPAPAGVCPAPHPGPGEPGNGGDDPGDGGGDVSPRPGQDPKGEPKPGDGGDRSVLVGQAARPVAAAAAPAGDLPFTGLPLALIALLGAAAIGTGALLRRKGRPLGSTAGPASR